MVDVKAASTVSEALAAIHAATGRRFLFLVDSWDILLREAEDDEALWADWLRFLNSVLAPRGEDDFVEAAWLTGVYPMPLTDGRPALAGFASFSRMAPGDLAQFDGFDAKEVAALCKRHSMDFAPLWRRYAGYGSRAWPLACPCDVTKALQRRKLDDYWVMSEVWTSLGRWLATDAPGLSDAVKRLLARERVLVEGRAIETRISAVKTADEVLTALVHLGYLAYDEADGTAAIPNEPVRDEFRRVLKCLQTADE